MTATLQPFGPSVGIETAIGADSQPKGRTMSASTRTERIRELNDALRTMIDENRCLFSPGVYDLGVPLATAALAIVKAFDEFTPENDPYGEHDFGTFEIDEERFIWKIDYYDRTLRFGSQDPADASQTKRVLTIMLEDEY